MTTVTSSDTIIAVAIEGETVVVTVPSPEVITVKTKELGPQGPGGALGLYATIIDTTDQPLAAANIAQPIQLGYVIESRGVSVASGNRITFELPGTYKILASLQVTNLANALTEVNFFFKKNGVTIADTNTRIDIQPRKSVSVPYHDCFTIELQVSASKNDYFQIYWVAERTGVSIDTIPADASHPRAPAVILNVVQVMYAQAGVPIGGAEGDILEKSSSTNYHTAWTDRLTLLEQRVTELEGLVG